MYTSYGDLGHEFLHINCKYAFVFTGEVRPYSGKSFPYLQLAIPKCLQPCLICNLFYHSNPPRFNFLPLPLVVSLSIDRVTRNLDLLNCSLLLASQEEIRIFFSFFDLWKNIFPLFVAFHHNGFISMRKYLPKVYFLRYILPYLFQMNTGCIKVGLL